MLVCAKPTSEYNSYLFTLGRTAEKGPHLKNTLEKRTSPHVKFTPRHASSVSSGSSRRGCREHLASVDPSRLRLPDGQPAARLRLDRPSQSRRLHYPQDAQVRRLRGPGRRRLEGVGRLCRASGKVARQEARRLQRLSKDPRSPRHRRGLDRHARPLAHEDRRRGDAVGQGRLLREAAHPDHRRRQAHRKGGHRDGPRVPGRHHATHRMRPPASSRQSP